MPLTCNIDAKGKLARLIYGLIMILAAILAAVFWAWPAGHWQQWLIVSVIFIFGAFGIFEARAGWCIVRAMGIKTKY